MKLKIYEYSGCGTCKKAFKWLDEKNISYDKVPIREKPPSKAELRKMLKILGGDSRKLFNTSGKDYKEMNLKDKLAKMSIEEQLELLASNGNLVKRPFVLLENSGIIGFKEEEWKEKIK